MYRVGYVLLSIVCYLVLSDQPNVPSKILPLRGDPFLQRRPVHVSSHLD